MRKRKPTGTSSSDCGKRTSVRADLLCHCQLEPTMKSNLLQMKAVPPVERFQRTVETLESNVNFDIRTITNEDGSERFCQIDLPNPGPHGGICRAYLASEQVDELIEALTVWKVLR